MTLWNTIKGFFSREARQLSSAWMPAEGEATQLTPEDSYFEVWLEHGFLAREMSWLKTRFPAAHVSVRMDVAGRETTLTRLAQPTEGMVGPGVWTGYPVTGPVPYRGGTIELEAGLMALERSSMLGVAVGMLGDFSGLVTPPLSEALQVAGKVADGVQALLDAGGGEIALGLHRGLSPSGAGGSRLAQGHLAVIGTPQGDLPEGVLTVYGGRLCVEVGGTAKPLKGFDYLLLRIDALKERADWRFPRFEQLMHDAIAAHFAGEQLSFERHRNDLLAGILNSPDLTRGDRNRVAKIAKAELVDATAVSNRFESASSLGFPEIIAKHAAIMRNPDSAQAVSLAELLGK